MRRMILFCSVLMLGAGLLLVGCGGDSGRTTAGQQQQGVADVIQEQADSSDDKAQATSGSSFVGDSKSAFASVDVDLTSMSSDMVYATVFDMVNNPGSYVDKVVRMSGPYTHAEFNGADYYAVIIEDATACCSQGVEFVWGDGSHKYPQDYPEDGHRVVVTGKLQTYKEGSNSYIHLVDSSLQDAKA